MSPDDELQPRPVPRFVPTLTEVVSAVELAATPVAPQATESAPAPDVTRAAAPALPGADELLARLGPDLDRLIAETVARVLHEQMLGFNGRVRKAVAEVVHEAVAKAVAQHGRGADVGENP